MNVATVPISEILLAGPRGFCAGVERAIDIVELALSVCRPPVYVRREIVHNRHVVESLRAKGAVFVDELAEVPNDATVIFSAHGISPAVREDAQRRRLRVIDATCPLVTKVHLEAVRYAREGYSIVLIGHEDHDEVIGAANSATANRLVEVAKMAGTHAHLINDVSDIRSEWLAGASRIGITAGASTPEMLVTQVVDALRGRGVSVREVHVVEEDVRFAIPPELERMAQERGMALPERTAMRQSI